MLIKCKLRSVFVKHIDGLIYNSILKIPKNTYQLYYISLLHALSFKLFKSALECAQLKENITWFINSRVSPRLQTFWPITRKGLL